MRLRQIPARSLIALLLILGGLPCFADQTLSLRPDNQMIRLRDGRVEEIILLSSAVDLRPSKLNVDAKGQFILLGRQVSSSKLRKAIKIGASEAELMTILTEQAQLLQLRSVLGTNVLERTDAIDDALMLHIPEYLQADLKRLTAESLQSVRSLKTALEVNPPK